MKPKTLSIVERQILANQFRILATQDEDNNEDYETKAEILEKGYTGEYDEVFNVYSDEVDYETCRETSEILNMYRRINNVIGLLTEEEKATLNLERIEFKGFDANNNSHFHYMTFMVGKLDKWQEHNGNYLNSHSAIPLMNYKRMLEYQNGVLNDQKFDLDIDDLRNLIELV
jgi:uncharacterized protein YfbU (UPF0304 family)